MKKLLAPLFLVLLAHSAQAGIVLEPYLGYQMGKAEATTNGGTSTSVKDTGTTLGLRAGYSFIIPFVTLDASYTTGKDDQTPSSDMKQTHLGLTAGLQMIPLIRPYAGYIFSAESIAESGSSKVTLKGTGFKLGLGFKILPLLNINLEYADLKFTDLTGIGSASKVSDVYSSFKYNTTTIGLSYVF